VPNICLHLHCHSLPGWLPSTYRAVFYLYRACHCHFITATDIYLCSALLQVFGCSRLGFVRYWISLCGSLWCRGCRIRGFACLRNALRDTRRCLGTLRAPCAIYHRRADLLPRAFSAVHVRFFTVPPPACAFMGLPADSPHEHAVCTIATVCHVHIRLRYHIHCGAYSSYICFRCSCYRVLLCRVHAVVPAARILRSPPVYRIPFCYSTLSPLFWIWFSLIACMVVPAISVYAIAGVYYLYLLYLVWVFVYCGWFAVLCDRFVLPSLPLGCLALLADACLLPFLPLGFRVAAFTILPLVGAHPRRATYGYYRLNIAFSHCCTVHIAPLFAGCLILYH